MRLPHGSEHTKTVCCSAGSLGMYQLLVSMYTTSPTGRCFRQIQVDSIYHDPVCYNQTELLDNEPKIPPVPCLHFTKRHSLKNVWHLYYLQ